MKKIFIIFVTLLLVSVVACTPPRAGQKGEPLIVKTDTSQVTQQAAQDVKRAEEDIALQDVETELAELETAEDASLEEDLDTI